MSYASWSNGVDMNSIILHIATIITVFIAANFCSIPTVQSGWRGASNRRPGAVSTVINGGMRLEVPLQRSAADHEIAYFCHVFHGKTHALAAQAAVLDAAIGHVVDAVAGHVADHHAADLQGVPG